jgi:hypothetical protein
MVGILGTSAFGTSAFKATLMCTCTYNPYFVCMYVPPKQNWNDEQSNVPVQWWALIGSCFSPLHYLQGSLLFHLLILILIHGYIGTLTCPTICISPLWEQSSWLLCTWTLETIQTCSPKVFSDLIVKVKNRDHNQEGSYEILMTKEEQLLSLVQVWRYAGHKLHICIPYPTCGHKKFVSWSLTQNFGYYENEVLSPCFVSPFCKE